MTSVHLKVADLAFSICTIEVHPEDKPFLIKYIAGKALPPGSPTHWTYLGVTNEPEHVQGYFEELVMNCISLW